MTVATLTDQDRTACIDYLQSFLDPVEGGSGRSLVQDVCAPILNSFSSYDDQTRLVSMLKEIGALTVNEPILGAVSDVFGVLALHLVLESKTAEHVAPYTLQNSATIAYSMAVSAARREPRGGMMPATVGPLKRIALQLLGQIELMPNRSLLATTLDLLDRQTSYYSMAITAQVPELPLPLVTLNTYDSLLASSSQATSRIVISRARRPKFSSLLF